MKKIFVASLSWNTDSESLKRHFSQIGDVEDAVVVKDRETGRSRGFGFVTFSSDEDAQSAVDKLENSVLDGRNIKVSIAQERPK